MTSIIAYIAAVGQGTITQRQFYEAAKEVKASK